jgi:hypothetical protein
LRGLLAGLVDDAGLFPPESLPMGAALARHDADEDAGSTMLSHRFLCPASRLGELRGELAGAGPGRGGPLRLGLVLDTGLGGLAAAQAEIAASEAPVTLETVDLAAPSPESVTAALEGLVGFGPAVFVEGPAGSAEWVKTVAAGSRQGGLRGAKIRCGGTRADLFPSPEALAGFVAACAENGVPFKATAGLHGAVRHRDARTGFVHHGFLNLLLAAVRASSGASAAEVAAVLSSTDGPALVAEARAVSARSVVAARLLFRSYGSCSTSEPRQEAAALGLLPDAGA